MSDKNIHQRILDVMKAVSFVQKTEGKGIAYKFVSHDDVVAKIRPTLIDNGIVVTQTVTSATLEVIKTKDKNGEGFTNLTNAHTKVDFINIDKPEEKISVESFGYGIDKQDKGPGKAMSYAFKYALLKCLCLETGDDPERDSIDCVSSNQSATYTGTAEQKKWLMAEFKKHGITDSSLMRDVSNLLMNKPLSELPALMKDAKVEQK